jgi:hypothetical protein
MSTPILQHATQSETGTGAGPGNAGDMRITLQFDSAMVAGRGAIYVTDGALQDVIDRATGAPLLQVVGATSTVKVNASSLHIDGATVTLDVTGLLPGHAYSVVMDGGVLAADDGAAFGGIRTTSQLQFVTAPVATVPALVSYDADGSLLNVNGSIALTLVFSEAVPGLTAAALHAPNASVTGLSSSDGGITWHATLQAPPNAVTAPANTLLLDLGQVVDTAGHPGSGVQDLLAYRVDTRRPTVAVSLDGSSLTADHGIVATLRFSEAVGGVDGALAAGHAGITDVHSIDGGITWTAQLAASDVGNWSANVLSVDLTRIHDLAGNAGSGVARSGTYVVATGIGTAVGAIGIIDHGPETGAGNDGDGVTDEDIQTYTGTLSRLLRAGQSVQVTVDGNVVGTATLRDDRMHWVFTDDRPLAEGAHTVSARVVDTAGHAGAASTRTYTIDDTAPDLVHANAGDSVDPASDIVLTFSEAVYANRDAGSAGLQLTQHGGATHVLALDDSNFSNGHRTVTLAAAALGLVAGADYTLLFAAGLSDLAGNTVGTPGIDIHTAGAGADVTPPIAQTVAPETDAGTYGVGAAIDFTVSFGEAVQVVDDAPVLHLNNGGRAVLVGASDDDRHLLFRYTVAAGDGATDSLDLANNTDLVGRIADSAGNVLDQAHVGYTQLAQAGHIAIDPAPQPDGPAAPVLAFDADSGVKGDGITSDATPTLGGSAPPAHDPDSTIAVYDGARLLGTTGIGPDGSWTFTVPGSAALADGAHTLTARQVDAAGHPGAASAPLTVTIDTTAPVVTGTHSFVKVSQNWIALAFDEPIVFTGGGAFDALDASNRQQARYTGDVHTNWDIVDGAGGANSVLELKLGIATGAIHLAEDTGTIQDLAGNVALIGSITLPEIAA